MKELKLKILGQYINLNVNGTEDLEQNDVTVNYYLKDIKEWPKRKTARTLPLKIYQTPQNRLIFNDAFNINNVNGWDLQSRVDAELFLDNTCILKGFIFIDTIDAIQNFYNVTLASNDVDIFNVVSDRLLSDLTFPASSFDHFITKSYVLNQFNNPSIGQTPLLYNIIDWTGEMTDVYHIQLRDYPILPSYQALFLFDKIMDDNGFSYTMSPDTSALLSKVYIPWNKEVDTIIPPKSYVTWIGNSSIDTSINAGYMCKLHMKNSRRPMDTLPTQIPLYYYETGNDFSQWHLGADLTNIASFPLMAGGLYKVVLTIDVSCPAIAVGSTVGASLVGNGWFDASSNTWATFTNQTLALGEHKYTFATDVYFPAWSVVNPMLTASDPSIAGGIGIEKATSTMEVFSYSWPYNGDVNINLTNALPQNYYQRDFISDFLTYFNAWIITDPANPKNLLIKTFDEYFKDLDYVDWSDRLDDSQESFFETCSKYISQTIEFATTADSDVYSADYASKNPQPMYYLAKSNTSELPNSGTDTLTIFSSPTAIYPIENIYVPKIYNNTAKMSWKPRLLFANSWTNSYPLHILITNDGTLITPPNFITTLTPFSTTNFADPSTVFLGFDNSQIYLDKKTITGRTVYNSFYKNELDMLLHPDAKMLTCKMVLKPEDAENCFSKKIWISNPKIGDALYRVNSILNYSNNRSTCDVELIKIVGVPVTWPTTITPTLLTLSPQAANTAAGSGGGSSGGGGGSSTLAGLNDVKLSEPQTGDGLVYNAIDGLWENMSGGFGQDASIPVLFSQNAAEDVSIAYLNTHKVSKSGDSMTGSLHMVNNSAITSDFIDSSGFFLSGFAGMGMQIVNNKGDYDATFDNLTVRKQMKVYELQIQKISAVAGGIVVSSANGKAYDVSTGKIFFDENGDKNLIEFALNDYIRAQIFSANGEQYYLGQVTSNPYHDPSLGKAYITVTDITNTCWVGADLVQVGNSTNVNRQNIIYLTAADSGNPYMDILAGVNTGNFDNKTKVRVGNLAGVSDPDFSPAPLTGYGLYANGDVYLKGNIQLANQVVAAPVATDPHWYNIDPGFGRPADNATLGGTWGVDINSIPSQLLPPSGNGLFISGDHMGYYFGGNWETYMDFLGNMSLGDVSNGNHGLFWNQTTGVLNIKGVINITNTIPAGSVSGLAATATNSDYSAVSNKPAYLQAPSGNGLFIDGTHLGYYSGGQWQSYIDNAGNCNFKGVGSFQAASVNEGGYQMGINISGDDIYEGYYAGNGGKLYLNRKSIAGTPFKRETLIMDGSGGNIANFYSSDDGKGIVQVWGGVYLYPMTTTERDAFVCPYGTVIYNSTHDQFEGRLVQTNAHGHWWRFDMSDPGA
jgi:hypothetical protein